MNGDRKTAVATILPDRFCKIDESVAGFTSALAAGARTADEPETINGPVVHSRELMRQKSAVC